MSCIFSELTDPLQMYMYFIPHCYCAPALTDWMVLGNQQIFALVLLNLTSGCVNGPIVGKKWEN